MIFLSLPLVGIGFFWLMPLPLAILVYLLILAVSGGFYWISARGMKRRSRHGVEAPIGTEARVVPVEV
jgi:hypothetical protein